MKVEPGMVVHFYNPSCLGPAPAKIVRPFLKKKKNLGTVPQACNPSYSGGRDQEDYGLKPARGKRLQASYLNQWLCMVV
jgi:hypothetical protein